MLVFPDKVNNREILYSNIAKNKVDFSKTDLKNWVVLVIEDDIKNTSLQAFENFCIEKNVLYMHATGKACCEVDDLFDWISIQRQEQGKFPSWMIADKDVLMTSWDYNLEEAFWFITTAANYDNHVIGTVLVANMTSTSYTSLIQELITRINSGWLPD